MRYEMDPTMLDIVVIKDEAKEVGSDRLMQYMIVNEETNEILDRRWKPYSKLDIVWFRMASAVRSIFYQIGILFISNLSRNKPFE